MTSPTCVITTINPPTRTVEMMVDRFTNVIVVGDKKTPVDWNYAGTTYYPHGHDFGFSFKAPDNHYARKNLGYLQAIKHGATLIYDIDDDNFPVESWKMREVDCTATTVTGPGWCNVFKRFTGDNIWPRGFALDHLHSVGTMGTFHNVHAPVQQGLANGNTDVDAIWRLAMMRDVTFTSTVSLALTPGVWCPFNSQTTWWWPEAYHLMYLPIYSTFRMCDIWRSFVAQRCLWASGYGVVFHSPGEVFQSRNPHNLLADFEDEVPGYLNNGKIASVLDGLRLTGSGPTDMLVCYTSLVHAGFLPDAELFSLDHWLHEITS